MSVAALPALFPIALDLDESVASQPRTVAAMKKVFRVPDADDIRLFGGTDAIARLRSQITALRNQYPGPWLTFIGSGDFHHVTLLLLETLPAEAAPYTLVLIDNHPDWFDEDPRYHCGNWVSGALGLEAVAKVILIGQNSPDLRWHKFYSAPIEEFCTGRLAMYPATLPRVWLPLKWGEGSGVWGTRLVFNTLHVRGAAGVFREVAQNLAGQRVYLSVDKDCLAPSQAHTDWEQGVLTVDELAAGIRSIRQACTLVGADVCGERAPRPLRGLWKRLDAGRWFGDNRPRPNSTGINEHANGRLLEAFGITAA